MIVVYIYVVGYAVAFGMCAAALRRDDQFDSMMLIFVAAAIVGLLSWVGVGIALQEYIEFRMFSSDGQSAGLSSRRPSVQSR